MKVIKRFILNLTLKLEGLLFDFNSKLMETTHLTIKIDRGHH